MSQAQLETYHGMLQNVRNLQEDLIFEMQALADQPKKKFERAMLRDAIKSLKIAEGNLMELMGLIPKEELPNVYSRT